MDKNEKQQEVITSIHDGIANVLSNISKEYGVQVVHVQVDWMDYGTISNPEQKHIRNITLETQSAPRSDIPL